MNPEQEQHLLDLLGEFNFRLDKTFREGAVEHGGDLRDMTPLQLIDNAIEETIDNYVYLMTLREKLDEPLR